MKSKASVRPLLSPAQRRRLLQEFFATALVLAELKAGAVGSRRR